MTRELIAKGAGDAGNFAVKRLCYPAARDGFRDMLAHIPDGATRGILLPAFIGWSPREGSGMFDPVRGTNTPVAFYEPTPDLLVDLRRLENALDQYRPAVTVLIHYWGRSDPQTAAVAALVRRYGSILVEDLAHGFYTRLRGSQAGAWGDANLYSLHKMLPLPQGGMVEYRDLSLLTGQRETFPELAAQIWEYDWAAIADRRRANFAAMTDLLREVPGYECDFSLIWPELDAFDVPQSLPIRVHNGSRDRIYSELNAQGFGMTSIYHTLIDDLRGRFDEMDTLAAQITNFPVHQDAAADHFEAMAKAFAAALEG